MGFSDSLTLSVFCSFTSQVDGLKQAYGNKDLLVELSVSLFPDITNHRFVSGTGCTTENYSDDEVLLGMARKQSSELRLG